MKKVAYCIIASLPLIFLACRKKTEIVSNSKYTDASFIFKRGIYHYRDSTGKDSLDYTGIAEATFGNGYEEGLKVFVNDSMLRFQDYGHGIYYSFYWGYTNEADNHKSDTAKWKVISGNNVQDMTYTVKALPYYEYALPYDVSLSTSLTFPVTAALFPGSDSISIAINYYNHEIDTIVNLANGPITFSPSRLASLPYNANYHYGKVSVYIFRKSTYVECGRNYHIENGTLVQYDINIKP